MDLVFVYGTLRASAPRDTHRLLAERAGVVGRGTTPGTLYDLGDYPGMVPEPGAPNIVHGEVYRLHADLAPESLRMLDIYEGCGPDDPEPHEYRRGRIPVTLDAGGAVEAWAYLLQRDVRALRRIPSGDYTALNQQRAQIVAERPRSRH